jgi:hypothetical protein
LIGQKRPSSFRPKFKVKRLYSSDNAVATQKRLINDKIDVPNPPEAVFHGLSQNSAEVGCTLIGAGAGAGGWVGAWFMKGFD